MKIYIALISLILAMVCSGCGTIVGHDVLAGGHPSLMRERNMRGVYRGVRVDAGWMIDSFTNAPSGLVALPFVLIDVPLSLGADTLVLPWDIADAVKHNASKEK